MKVPKLYRQKTKYSDLAFVRITGKKFYCGVWGSPESKVNYLQLINQWTAAMTMFPSDDVVDDDWEWDKLKKPNWKNAILDHVKKNRKLQLPPPQHPVPPILPLPKTELTVDTLVAALKQAFPVTNPQPPIPSKPKVTVTIDSLVAAFLEHAETYYTDAEGLTDTYSQYVRNSDMLKERHGTLSVDEFSPVLLEKLRSDFIVSRKKPLCRSYVNKCIGQIRKIFEWGVSRKMVKPDTYASLVALDDLKKGRSKAKEPRKVKPVDDVIVDKTLPFLPSVVQSMVKLQRLTGMRPEEVRVMRLCDIDTNESEWFYIPWKHKLDHLENCSRLVVFGERSQAILKHYLTANQETPEAFLFSPQEAVDERKTKLRAKRKTKVQPSQKDRSKPNAKKVGDMYSKDSYGRVIKRAAEKAGVPHCLVILHIFFVVL